MAEHDDGSAPGDLPSRSSSGSPPPRPTSLAIDGGRAKLEGVPPPTVAVALRAESVSEGRRDVVRAMFEVAWWPMLGAFSQVF